jgi:hypothetical protein
MVKEKKDKAFLRAFAEYLCKCKRPQIVLESERNTISLHLRATIAIYGSVIFWVGGWNLLTEAYPHPFDPDAKFQLFPDGMDRELFYAGLGLALMISTDTLYGNAGLSGGYYPPSILCSSMYGSITRTIVGLLGSG